MSVTVMPYLGQMVWWYPGGNRDEASKSAAFVTRLGNNNVNLNILDPQSYNFRIRDYVRHIDDPTAKDNEKHESGMWDFTDHDKDEMRRRAAEQAGEKKKAG